VALRGLFLIDPRGLVRHALINDLVVGRNIKEVLRTLLAVRLIDAYGDFCPANWKPGDPAISTARDYMKEYFKNRDR
jgi:peroxiredoxin (alkyl hydroperoxide reductase subunit C)